MERNSYSRSAWTTDTRSETNAPDVTAIKKDADSVNENFASSTTMHGVYFLHKSDSKLAKGFWIFLILGMSAMLTYQIVDRIIAYFEYDTSSSITQDFVTHLPFPAVTICSFNRFYMKNPNPKILNAIHLINQLITPENVVVNAGNKKRPNLTEMASLDSKIDVVTLFQRHGFSVDHHAMPRCTFRYEECSPDDFTPIFSWMGRCFTFNAGNQSKIQNIPGSGNGLAVTIDIRSELFTEEPVFGIREAGLKVQVHPPDEIPDVGTFGISVPVGRKASIEISRHDFDIMYKPWGRCDPKREELKYFSLYTLNNCMQECYTNAVIEQCGCYPFIHWWAKGFAQECSAEQLQDCAAEYLIEIQQNYSANTCNCTVPCSFTTYESSISYATYPNAPTANKLAEVLNTTVQTVESNIVEFDIYFKSMSYQSFRQSKKIDESSLLSDMGGQLGLWLGMSLITAVEVVQFIARKISELRKKKST